MRGQTQTGRRCAVGSWGGGSSTGLRCATLPRRQRCGAVVGECVCAAPQQVAAVDSPPLVRAPQFFITLAPTPWLDGKHTIFGRVCGGMGVIKRLGNVQTDATDRPTTEVKILRARTID